MKAAGAPRPALGLALQQQLRQHRADDDADVDDDAPDAINVPFPRPAALFRLSSGSSSDSEEASVSPAPPAPFGRFALPDVKLRKIVRRPIFENFDESAYDVKAPTQMLRFIDELRYHKPTDEERDALNISSSTERLYLHLLNDILVTCGARKGFRFSSRDIVRLRGIAESLDTYYDAVDEAFRGLSSDVIRFRFPTTTRRLEDDAANFERLQNNRKNGTCKVEGTSTHHTVQHQAFHFQWLARQYIVAFARLRNAVMEIRLRLLRTTKNPPLVPKLSDLNDPVEAEFEAKTHHPFPVYLHVLIQKYHREHRQQTEPWSLDSLVPPVDSIAHFALYLSELLLQRSPAPSTATELLSLQVLLQVVKVQFHVDEQKMALQVIRFETASGRVLVNPALPAEPCYPHDGLIVEAWTSSSSSSTSSDSGSEASESSVGVLTRGALTTLLFGFLTTVRELRLVPRDKDLLKRRRPAKPVGS